MQYYRTLKRTAAVGVLCVSGAVAAFATIAPGPEADALPMINPVVEPVEIRPEETLLPAPEVYIREERYQHGDTLAALLGRLGVASPHVDRLVRLRSLQHLRPGYSLAGEITADGEPRRLSFLTTRDTVVQVEPEGNGYRVSENPAQLEARILMKSSEIRSSLFAASDAAGIPDAIAIQLADIFGGDIDFHRDLRKGDRFSVVYELHHYAGRPVKAGRVLAAEFFNDGRTYRAVQYGAGYYAPDGKNLRKAFLRSPLEFSRVSSGFGMRMHPIAKAWRAHKGVDYAAPTGTRVRAVGDGVVEYAGAKGGYGNVVILRHNGQHSTLYAHLSRISVKRGARVSQNDTIGAVGRTGWATGPHLHYEFLVAGQARNPLSMAMPAALPVPPQELAAFRSHATPLVARLELLANGSLALLD